MVLDNNSKNKMTSNKNDNVLAVPSNSAFIVQKGKEKDFLRFVDEKSAASQAAMNRARVFAKQNKK